MLAPVSPMPHPVSSKNPCFSFITIFSQRCGRHCRRSADDKMAESWAASSGPEQTTPTDFRVLASALAPACIYSRRTHHEYGRFVLFALHYLGNGILLANIAPRTSFCLGKHFDAIRPDDSSRCVTISNWITKRERIAYSWVNRYGAMSEIKTWFC